MSNLRWTHFSKSCAGNATSSEKVAEKMKILTFGQFFCEKVLPAHRVAGLQFFPAIAAQ